MGAGSGWCDWGLFRDFMPEIESLAALAYEAGRKDENEACAKVCDAAQLFGNIDERWAAKCCSDQIRARREQ